MNPVRSNTSVWNYFKYKRFKPSVADIKGYPRFTKLGSKNIGNRKSEKFRFFFIPDKYNIVSFVANDSLIFIYKIENKIQPSVRFSTV